MLVSNLELPRNSVSFPLINKTTRGQSVSLPTNNFETITRTESLKKNHL